jgi:acetyl/propionyl-CoA carboxylase alpha subunit
MLGDKIAARRSVAAADVQILPGTLEPVAVGRADGIDGALEAAETIGFPLFVKAAAGGGGRGMRRVARGAELPAALAAGSAEALAAFGDGAVYLEREINPARHIEVQLLGDVNGSVVALGERDCSLQRRHQKLVEEAPAPLLEERERRNLHEMAVRAARAVGLVNAATAEFLFDPDRRFWFLEVNTRLQVEHGVTELVADVDIVREQLWLAARYPLSERVLTAADRAATPTRHAIEVRISAEDPSRAFAPTPGTIDRWDLPSGPGIRVDAAVGHGTRIPADYDPLIAKLMVVDESRAAAIERLARALDETTITGIQTTLPFHRFIAGDPGFRAAEVTVGWVDEHWPAIAEARRRASLGIAARAAATAVETTRIRSAAGAPTSVTRDGSTGPVTPSAPSEDGWPSRSADPGSAPSAWIRTARARAAKRWHR